MATHAGAHTCAGEFASHGVGGAAFEALGENGYRECGRVRDQYVEVVGFAVELDQIDIELGADGAHGGFSEGEHWVGEQFSPVFGYEDEVGVQQRHAVPFAAVGRLCQWAPLRLSCG